jgi:hypothetical protein
MDHNMSHQHEDMDSQPTLGNVLPTPDKTPKKRPTKAAPGISAIARTLFPVRPESIDEVMPSPRKRNKKHNGYSLDSFSSADGDLAQIEIFTDSHERIPELDTSAENPFYRENTPKPTVTKCISKIRKVTVPGEGELTVEEAEQREDGLVYVL